MASKELILKAIQLAQAKGNYPLNVVVNHKNMRWTVTQYNDEDKFIVKSQHLFRYECQTPDDVVTAIMGEDK